MKEIYRLADFTIEEGEVPKIYGYVRADSEENARRLFIAMGFQRLVDHPWIFRIEKVTEARMLLDLQKSEEEINRLKRLVDSIRNLSDE